MPHAVQLTPMMTSETTSAVCNSAALQITVTQAINMPAEIFVMQNVPVGLAEAAAYSKFSHVCSPRELQELPVGAPLPGGPPWFRVATINLVGERREDLVADYSKILGAAKQLCASLDMLGDLQTLPSEWAGTP